MQTCWKKVNILQNALHEENIHEMELIEQFGSENSELQVWVYKRIFHINLVSIARFKETE